MELKKHITDEKTEISYTLCGDYFLDDFELRLIIRAPEVNIPPQGCGETAPCGAQPPLKWCIHSA